MGETKVKICGIQEIVSAHAAIDYGVDFLGFVFVPKHRYFITPDDAKKIIVSLGKLSIGFVGVFINENRKKVNQISQYCGLTHVQLHGNESPQYCKQISNQVIKTLAIKNSDTTEEIINQLRSYTVPFFLLDRFNQGEGKRIRYDLGAEIASKYPIFFAGGINPDNVKETIKAVRPFAIDVASGVETNGIKDPIKIRNLITSVKSI